MKIFKSLMWAAVAGLPLLSAPAMAQGGTGHSANNGMSATGSGASVGSQGAAAPSVGSQGAVAPGVGSTGSMSSSSSAMPRLQSPSQLPAAQGGTDGASAGESGGSGGGSGSK